MNVVILVYLDIMEYRMGGGHLADMRKLRKRGAKLQDVVDFFLKKVNWIVNQTKVVNCGK